MCQQSKYLRHRTLENKMSYFCSDVCIHQTFQLLDSILCELHLSSNFTIILCNCISNIASPPTRSTVTLWHIWHILAKNAYVLFTPPTPGAYSQPIHTHHKYSDKVQRSVHDINFLKTTFFLSFVTWAQRNKCLFSGGSDCMFFPPPENLISLPFERKRKLLMYT